jgi:hypothetical protein
MSTASFLDATRTAARALTPRNRSDFLVTLVCRICVVAIVFAIVY